MRISRSQSGYTLVEALIVILIIGLISTVAIPNFMTIYRADRIKASLRYFTNDIRLARQRAVSRFRKSKVSYIVGGNRGSYQLYEGVTDTAGVVTWTATFPTFKQLEERVYFFTDGTHTTFDDIDDPVDGTQDLVYLENGSLQTAGNIYMRTEFNVPVNEYKIAMTGAGALTVTGSKF